MTDTANGFWVVWNPTARPPTVAHQSRTEAENEAKRLACKCPGEVFIVLKSVSGFSAKPPCANRISDARIIGAALGTECGVPF